ncbi:MAG: hypothetical protein A2V99_13605 [Spirochaetes bacterium RBG_16_67_19]|nr:MAG: hypothetical protein A2V99_13605 [Spirochaetes bacterium RBG_16_67_19]
MAGTIEAKRAAAVAAVFSYLAQGALQPGAQQQQAAVPGVSLWALYGRQALMSQAIRLQARRRG